MSAQGFGPRRFLVGGPQFYTHGGERIQIEPRRWRERYARRRRRAALTVLGLIGLASAWAIYRAAFGWPH